MFKFEDQLLRRYVDILLAEVGVEATISDHPIAHERTHLRFFGKLGNGRNELAFYIPIDGRRPGIISAQSVIAAPKGGSVEWAVGGQSAIGGKVVAAFPDDKAVALHASMQMIHDWTHAGLASASEADHEKFRRAYNADFRHYMAKGVYGDEVSIGRYVDAGGDTLSVELEALPTQENTPAPGP